MIESDEYCIDVLTQISAATRALRAVSIALLDEHLHNCVTGALESGGRQADPFLPRLNPPPERPR